MNVLTFETDDEHAYDHILEWYDQIWDWYGMTESQGLVAAGTVKTPVENRPELLERAREIGRNL